MGISTPPQKKKSGSYFYNYKGFFSIIMLAIVNSNYEFMYLNIGKNGRNSDANIIEHTKFYQLLQSGSLNLLTCNETLEGMNCVLVADDAFAVRDLLKPFPVRNMTPEHRIFTYRLSRAQRLVENAFGIMANRFHIF